MGANYVEPHLTTINDLFGDFNVDKVHGKGNVKRKYKCSDKKALARKIFLRYLYHLMEGMMEGGSTFVFPTRKHMELRWRRIPDERFKAARARGEFADIDVLRTDRICYELIMYYKIGSIVMYKPVRLSKNFRAMFAKKVNTGYKYC